MALEILDDFARADENPLSQGGNWTGPVMDFSSVATQSTQAKIVSLQCVPDDTDPDMLGFVEAQSYRTDVDAADVRVAARIADLGSSNFSPAISARVQNPGTPGATEYVLYVTSPTELDLFTNTPDNIYNFISSFGVPGDPLAVGDWFRIDLIDDQISVYVQRGGATPDGTWELCDTITDGTITGPGSVGVEFFEYVGVTPYSALDRFALEIVPPPAPATPGVLYGALCNEQDPQPSDLYTIDKTTGVATSIGPTGYAITALAVDPTDLSLYGVTTGFGPDANKLLLIDADTGRTVVVGMLSETDGMVDMAFNSAGILYAWTLSGGQQLCLIDKTDGTVTLLGSDIGADNGGLAFDSNDVLWFVQEDSHELYTLSPVDGVGTFVADLSGYDAGHGTDSEVDSATFDTDDVMYASYMADRNDDPSDVDLITIGADGVRVLVGATTPAMNALAFCPPAPPTPPAASVYEGYPYRTAVTTLDMELLTFLDRLASNQSYERVLCKPATARGQVPSWSREVNIPHTDGEAFLGYADRLLFLLRRQSPTSPKWVPMFSGILLPLQDEADSDNATSSYTAIDPWQLLYARPVVNDELEIPLDDWEITGKRADEIIIMLLENMRFFCATGPHSDAFIDWGQDSSPFYEGTIEETSPTIDSFTIQQHSSVGEVFDQLVEDGYCEIVLEPIYEPALRPGLIVELSVYQVAGQARNDAIMAWDKPSRSLVGIDRLEDGTQLANKVRFYAGQGGTAVPIQTDASSVARYGEYWTQQDIVSQPGDLAPVTLLAAKELLLRKRGKRTLNVKPATLRSPIPYIDYTIGDSLPVYASNRFREAIGPTLDGSDTHWVDLQRVWGISIQIDAQGTETVDRLLLSREST